MSWASETTGMPRRTRVARSSARARRSLPEQSLSLMCAGWYVRIAALPMDSGGIERVDELHGGVGPGLVLDLDDAGRAGDVDLGEPVADHVEPGEDDAFPRGLHA